jgi:hypothetical protein
MNPNIVRMPLVGPTVIAILVAISGCTTLSAVAPHATRATVRQIVSLRDLRKTVDPRCLGEGISPDQDVVIVSFKQGRMPHYLALQIPAKQSFSVGDRIALQVDQCRIEVHQYPGNR